MKSGNTQSLRLYVLIPDRGSGEILDLVYFFNKTKGKSSARKKKQPRNRMVPQQFGIATAMPFSNLARGVRFPDENTFPSVTYLGTARSNLVGGVNQNFAAAYYSQPQQAVLVPSSVSAGNSISWGGSTAFGINQVANLITQCETYRCPAWGIRISCLSSLTTANGALFVAVVPITNTGLNYLPTDPDRFTNCIWHDVIPISELCQKVRVIPGRIIDSSVHRYRLINANPGVPTTDIETTNGHVAIVLLGIGTTSTLTVEYMAHLECVPLPSIGNFDAIPSPHIPVALEQQRVLDIGLPTTYLEEDSENVVMNAMRNAGRVMGSIAASAATNFAQGAMRSMFGRRTVMPTSYLNTRQPRLEYKESGYTFI